MANPSDPLTASRPSPGNGHVPLPDGGAGHALGAAPSHRVRPPGPSAKPAAVVFGIIAVLFVAGFVADDLTSAHHPAAAPSVTTTASAVPGTGGLVPVAVKDVIDAIVTADEPPADVLGALVVPRGTAPVPGTATQRGVGLYDATIGLQVPATEADTITFVRTELAAGKWHVVSSGPSGSDYRIVAQHPGSDGYEWDVGFTVSPTAFASTVPGTSVPASGVTPLTLRLFANSYYS